MVNLTCIAQKGECDGSLQPAGKDKRGNYTIFYFDCDKCHTRHYLPQFEGVELALEDYQEFLMLDNPSNGMLDRGEKE